MDLVWVLLGHQLLKTKQARFEFQLCQSIAVWSGASLLLFQPQLHHFPMGKLGSNSLCYFEDYYSALYLADAQQMLIFFPFASH
jgi:hypothetical protein